MGWEMKDDRSRTDNQVHGTLLEDQVVFNTELEPSGGDARARSVGGPGESRMSASDIFLVPTNDSRLALCGGRNGVDVEELSLLERNVVVSP
jgi:hypothetical protein